MIKYFTIEDLLKHYLQKKFHILAYLSTAKSLKVDRGYYYRVHCNHIAGNEYPYEEDFSVTNGILIP